MQKNVKEENIYQIHFKTAHGSRKIIHLKKDKTFLCGGFNTTIVLNYETPVQELYPVDCKTL